MSTNHFTLSENQCFSTFETNLSLFSAAPTAIPNNAFLNCISGSAKIEINLEQYNINSDNCLYIFNNSLIKVVSASEDFKCETFLFDKGITLDAIIGLETELLKVIFENPVITVTDPNERKIINDYYDIFNHYSKLPEYGHHYDFVCGNIRNMILSRIYIIRRSKGQPNSALGGYSTSDNYFRQFMKLLSEHSRIQHDVAFYADALSITPKYLNEISRKKARTTAKDVITQYVVAQIKRELILSGNPVQRIAYDFNFSDQSSFGKYFKKTVGLSPMAFRKKRIKQYEE